MAVSLRESTAFPKPDFRCRATVFDKRVGAGRACLVRFADWIAAVKLIALADYAYCRADGGSTSATLFQQIRKALDVPAASRLASVLCFCHCCPHQAMVT